MTGPLRIALVFLVLANLAFVEITEGARWIWLGPLVALTAASPWLLRFTHLFFYRAAWNCAVLGVFALLVHHVTGSGVQYLLEDGLLLAALCQVHLLNNLNRLQKPDLLFFNSFLIAVVTSFLSLDVRYFVIFLLYAPILVVAMQIQALDRAGVARTAGVLRRAVTGGLARSALVLGLTLVVFFFLPRDFARRGLVGDRFRFEPPGATEVGFSEEVSLAETGDVRVSDRIVMKVRMRRGSAAAVPAHWRGATLDDFDGEQWRTVNYRYRPQEWRVTPYSTWALGDGRSDVEVEVHLLDRNATRLFLPLSSRSARDTGPAQPRHDLNFVRAGGDRRPLRYILGLSAEQVVPAGRRAWSNGVFRTHVRVRPGSVPTMVWQHAREIRATLPSDAPQHAVVEKMRRFLSSRYEYLLPGADGGAKSLAEFIHGGSGAHCEYFATALAVMLRTQGIPTRLVTGYRTEEWDEEGAVLTVRARHAHAWVEVLDPKAGWYTVDPTPAAAADASGDGTGLFAAVGFWFSRLWDRVAGFDERRREQFYASVAISVAQAAAYVQERPVRIALVCAGTIAFLIALRRLLRRTGPPAVRDYRRCLLRFGLEMRAGETPRELLARAELEPRKRSVLEAATQQHERRRYHTAHS